ncbi:homocysteine S-methyltransferase family protein [Hoeflea olei]|uniref:Homocysteine methyltransferase n=1 Tax=Hoeflea olei TaxID=1480615 RepID=A0A1C1Z0G3_9HYPH|nr:homocysteine S-methyltransferase family protein [Hoeflea olei]OCW59235.1 homocysteine methyltransferase [Hoeflea olei]
MTEIVLLDGGMGQELIHRSSQPPSPLWSAKVMMDEPEIVEAVHREYIDAGARVLTLNSYSATPERLARDASEDLFEPLQAKAIAIARAARGDRDITIAGCLSPLYGSYHPEWAPSLEECLATYRRIVAQQRDAVDVFLCETLASVKEVRAAVQAAVESGKPVWCGMTVDDRDGTKLRSGEDLETAATAAREAGAEAVLVNCSWPEAVTQGQAVLARTGLAHGGYANGFTNAGELEIGGTVKGLKTRTDLDPRAYADHAMRWIEAGATIVGGCCEVGPAHIAHLAERLVAAGHQIRRDLK